MCILQFVLLILVLEKSAGQEPLDQLSSRTENPQTEEDELSPHELTALKSISLTTDEFAIQLYSSISKNGENMVVSPLCLQLLLALTFTGAKGVTATELATLLNVLEIADETKLLAHKTTIMVVQNSVLTLSNRMFVEVSDPVKEDFQKTVEDYFFSPAEPLDFKDTPEKSRELINSWMERQTHDQTKDLLATGDISGDTRLVLVNAIHFKTNWKTKFDESKTKERPFYLTSTEEVKVSMMNTKSSFHFLHDFELGVKILRLDYEGENFELVFILPDNLEGPSELESKLGTIFERINGTKSTTVDVYLPKFKIEMTMELNSVLKSMGVPTMFNELADFGTVADDKLSVSYVVQKAFIEVNEERTEVAAGTASDATTVIASDTASTTASDAAEATASEIAAVTQTSGQHHEHFTADRPFLFLIGLREHEIPIILGHYVGPK